MSAQVYDVSFSRFSDRGADLRLLVYKLSGDTYYPYIIEERHFHYDERQAAIQYATTLKKRKEELEATQPTVIYHQHDTVSNEISQQLASGQQALSQANQRIALEQLSLPISG